MDGEPLSWRGSSIEVKLDPQSPLVDGLLGKLDANWKGSLMDGDSSRCHEVKGLPEKTGAAFGIPSNSCLALKDTEELDDAEFDVYIGGPAALYAAALQVDVMTNRPMNALLF